MEHNSEVYLMADGAQLTAWNILLINDHPEDDKQIQGYLSNLKERATTLQRAASLDAAWDALEKAHFDVVLIHEMENGSSGVAFIRRAIERGIPTPFILIADREHYDLDVEAMQAGALDYLNRAELTPALLERSIRYAVETQKNLQALRDREERFVMAVRAVNGVVYDWDLSTNHIFRSDGLQQVIGVRPSEITQEHGWWENRVHPDDFPLLEETINEKIKGEASAYELEYRVQHLAGYWIDVWEQAYILRDSQGKAYRVVGTRTDITGRKRGELNARFLAELGEQMLTLKEPEAMFAYASQGLMQHLGLERISFDQVDQQAETVTIVHEQHLRPPAIVGMHPFSPFHREMQKRMVKGQAMVVADTALDPATALYEAALAKFDFRSFVAIPRLIEGRWVATMSVAVGYARHWREDELALLKQSSDLVWLAVENARLVKQLREAQERFEIAIKNSLMTVYTNDMERRYTWVANAELDTPDNSIIGKRDEDLLPAKDIREIIEAKNAVLSSGIGIQKECKITFRNMTRYIDMVIEPLRNSAGEMEGLIVAALDKTQRKEIEQKIQDATNQIEVQRRMEQLREDERQKIARDLHDGPIQEIIGLLFSIKTLSSFVQDEEGRGVVNEVEAETQKLIGELRSICNELRPPILVQFGLSSAIRAYAEDFRQKHAEINIRLEISDAGRLLPDNVRLALYRICQEALNNVVRHAQATEITIILGMAGRALQLEISDNGKGFESSGSLVTLAREGHFGLVGMRERAEAVGGTLQVTSSPGAGTRLVINVPVLELAEKNN